MPPTIIVCEEKVEDFSLFWNIRAQLDIGSSGTIVLFPEREIDKKESVESLTEWIIKSPIDANYVHIRSVSVAKSRLDNLARKLRPRLKSSRIEHVDVVTEAELAPVVLPYEKETHTKVFFSGNELNFDTIKPNFIEYTGRSNSWICDLVEDSDNKRALCEIVLPPRSSAIQVLNAPCPPKFNTTLDKIRWGPDSLNIKCDSHNPTISFGIPTNEELIKEILKEAGITFIKDEKRIRYNQVIEIMGGLKDAFLTFSGSSLRVIESFLDDNSASQEKKSIPLPLNKIKSKARLNKSGATASRPVFDTLKKYLPNHAKSIAQQRFDKYFEYDISHGKNEQKIINRLLQRNVLKRKWKLEKCRFCDKEYWVEHIDINKPINCPGCENIITLGGQVILGYELNELVRLAIKEGIIPVILTANFLYNATFKSFIWLPGVKCQWDNIKTDLDLICICDGHMFAAECKTMKGVRSVSRTWSSIVTQLGNPLKLAKKANFEGFIVSSLTDNYPQRFQKKLKSMSQENVKISYFNKKDLISGIKKVKRGNHERSLMVDDLLDLETKRKEKSRKKKVNRLIRF